MRSKQVFALIALISLAAFEQVNLKQASAVSRRFERQHLSAVGRPPLECQTFYVAAEIAPEVTGHGLPLSKCEAYNRVYDQPC